MAGGSKDLGKQVPHLASATSLSLIAALTIDLTGLSHPPNCSLTRLVVSSYGQRRHGGSACFDLVILIICQASSLRYQAFIVRYVSVRNILRQVQFPSSDDIYRYILALEHRAAV